MVLTGPLRSLRVSDYLDIMGDPIFATFTSFMNVIRSSTLCLTAIEIDSHLEQLVQRLRLVDEQIFSIGSGRKER